MAATTTIAASLLHKATAVRLLAVRSSVGAVLPPPPPRLTRRRNYLRRKLLKTLTKPSSETLNLTQTPAGESETAVREFEFEASPIARGSENSEAAKPVFDAVEESEASSPDAKASDFAEVSVSEASGVVEASPSGLGWVSARSVVRFGACFVGIFILQAIVRALVVDSADSSDDKRRRRRSDGEEVGIDGKVNPFREKLEMKNGALLYVNEAEMEKKIAEITMMAMEAKERERKNSGEGYLGSDEEEGDSDDEVEDDGSRAKSGIEREIDGRLTRVRRGLDTVRENSQVMNVNFLNKPKQDDAEKVKNNVLGEKEEDKMLMFEKKYKFRSGDSSKPRDKPKGFQGSDRIGRNGSISGKANGFSKKAVRVDMESSSDLKREVLKISDGDDIKKTAKALSQFQDPKKDSGDESLGMDLKKDIEVNVEQNKGNVQESTAEQSADKVTRPRMSENIDSQNIVIGGGKTKTSRKNVVPQSNGRSKGRRVGSTPSSSRGDSKKTDAGSDLWWLNLPYLFAIAMHQAYGDEGERGFYSLKTICDDPTQTHASYTVLFQDRGDAHNFSHILESFFEELEDISISVIPLPIKELNDAVKSQTKKVIAVRKGQLRLYAGQPLDEVETALRSLV